jgi:chemotaxis protein histidine kinase CheA
LPKLDPEALDRELAKAQQPDAPIDETNIQHALSLELDKRPLTLPDGATSAIVASGVLRVGPFQLDGPRRRATVSGAFDLKTLEFSANAVFESDRVAKFWSGPSPAIAVSLAGPLDAPQRKIDDTGLAAGLAAQALARESDRIATLEADIRERAFFNREKKAWAFLDRRKVELADFVAEAERIKARAEHERAEAEAEAAEQVRQAAKWTAVVKRKAAERALVEAEKKAEEQAAAEAKRKADEQAAAEAKRKADEQAAAEAKRKADEQAAAEARRKADQQADEDARRKAEDAAVAESLRKAATEAKARGTLPPPAPPPSPSQAPSDPAAAGIY